MHKYFSEWYRFCHVDPSDSLLKLRWNGIDSFIIKILGLDEELQFAKMLDIVRLFFFKSTISIEVIDEFKQSFKDSDAAFPMRDNDLELRILAGASIVKFIQDCGNGNELGIAIASSCAYCRGLKDISPLNEIIDIIQDFITNNSYGRSKASTSINIHGFSIESNDTSPETPDETDDDDEYMRKASEYSNTSAAAICNLSKQLQLVEEETNILWWLFGEWSNDNNKPMADFPIDAVCIIAGKELADMISNPPGPVSAIAILRKMISVSSKGAVLDISSIEKAVKSLPSDWCANIAVKYKNSDLLDFCPILFGIIKSTESDGKDDWLPVFSKKYGYSAIIEMPIIDLSLQVYCEIILSDYYEIEE